MNEQAQDAATPADNAQLTVAVAMLPDRRHRGFYLLDTQPDWLRWGERGGGAGRSAVVVFALSRLRPALLAVHPRARASSCARSSGRPQEKRCKTTLVVFVFVTIAGLFFWLLDLLLAWATRF